MFIITVNNNDLRDFIPNMDTQKFGVDRTIKYTTTNYYVLLAIVCDHSRANKYDSFKRPLIRMEDITALKKPVLIRLDNREKHISEHLVQSTALVTPQSTTLTNI